MKDLFSKCGYNCGRCPAYRENATTDEVRKWGSDGWKKYYGFQIKYERMYCDGCQMPDAENPKLLALNCRIRKCAFTNGVETCAHCGAFQACMHELKIFNPNINRAEIESRMGAPMPEQHYLGFVEPFEHLKHLDQIRGALTTDDIIEPEVSTTKVKIIEFPERLSLPEHEISSFKKLHQLLSELAMMPANIPYAQQKELEKRRTYFLTLLWTFGMFGEFQNNSRLIIDSKTYVEQKLTTNTTTMNLYLAILKKHGVVYEYAPLPEEQQDKKGWKTPMGWLRITGWFMTMAFDDSIGGADLLKTLQNYTNKLQQQYHKKAFRYFKTVDMRNL